MMNLALQRILDAAGCKSQIELAALLNVPQALVSDVRRRGSIPSEWLNTLCQIKNINPEWVITGQAPQYLQPHDTIHN